LRFYQKGLGKLLKILSIFLFFTSVLQVKAENLLPSKKEKNTVHSTIKTYSDSTEQSELFYELEEESDDDSSNDFEKIIAELLFKKTYSDYKSTTNSVKNTHSLPLYLLFHKLKVNC
jgi:hypothetical protein